MEFDFRFTLNRRLQPMRWMGAAIFLLSCGTLQIAISATYYVDADVGDNVNEGTLIERPWKNLEPVNARVFQPGDKILFKAGTVYQGQLKPQGSGKLLEDRPLVISIGKYGQGASPRINGDGAFLDTVLLKNVGYWEVRDLEITNLGTNRVPWRTGVHLIADGAGTMHHLHLQNLLVHDVNGDLRKSDEGCGIFFESRGGNNSHFDDLLIENCHIVRTDRNGICQRGGRGSHSQRVIIRGNLLEDIGGDGIKLWGTDGGLVERNILRGGRMRCEDYAAGIWPFDCNDTVVQFNEVSGMKGTKDGQGFDADYRCRNSLFQYNYSHDNDGGFMLICTPGNSWNVSTVIRYNISQNDGVNSARVFHFGGGASNAMIYNNTIYIGPKQDLPLLLFSTWDGGNADGTRFFNNIFFVDGRVTYDWGKSTNTFFEHNVFYGRHEPLPADAGLLTNRPALAAPGTGGNGLNSLDGYRLKNARAFLPGRIIANNGGRDFFGNPVPENGPPSLGACELSP